VNMQTQFKDIDSIIVNTVYFTIEDGKLTLWDMPRDGCVSMVFSASNSGITVIGSDGSCAVLKVKK
jgi:hypothetical protein